MPQIPSRPDLPVVHLPAPAAELRRLGQSRRAAAGAGARRARPLPQLGLGGRGPAPRLPHHRAGPARPRRQRLVDQRRLFAERLRLRPRPADPPAAPGALPDRRPLARRQHQPALRRRLPGEREQAGGDRGLGPSPAMLAERAARGRSSGCAAGSPRQRKLAARIPRRYATLEDAFHRMQAENRAPDRGAGALPHPARRDAERGRHL